MSTGPTAPTEDHDHTREHVPSGAHQAPSERASPDRRRLLAGLATVVGATAATQVATQDPAAAAVPDDRSVTPPKFAPSAIDPAPNVAGARTLGDGWLQAASGAVVSAIRARDIDPHFHGFILPDGSGARAALLAALQEGNRNGGGATIRLRPNQVYDVESGLPMAGFTSGIVGAGCNHNGSKATGSVIKASSQSGPVLDLGGFRFPPNQLGKVLFGSFAVEGSGAPGGFNTGIALRVVSPSTWTGAVHFDDIVISDTGGACLFLDRTYLSEFTNIVLVEPVGVLASNVPYFHSIGSNNNLFSRIGFRGISSGVNVAHQGAAVISSAPSPDGRLDSHSNIFDSWWYEYVTLGEGSTSFHLDAWGNTVRDFHWVDCEQDPSAADTSHIRLAAPAATTQNPVMGGNIVRGHIPGRGTERRLIRWGVDVHTPFNRIEGVKGFKGHNVRLRPFVHSTHVDLGGAISGASDEAVIDESGFVSSHYAWQAPNCCTDPFVGQCGLRLAGEGALPAPIATLRGRIWLVHGGSGQADTLHVCLKNADGSFRWQALG